MTVPPSGSPGSAPQSQHPESLQSRQWLWPDWVIPIEPRGTVLGDHILMVEDQRIAEIFPAHELAARHPGARVERLSGCALLPGLVNLHSHAAMSLLRGYADDVALMDWLQEFIWPAEARWVSESFVEEGSALACAEFLLAGVTTFNDMYFFPQSTARAVLASGLRGVLGITVLEFPTAYARDPADYLQQGLATRDAFRHESRLSFALAPHAPYTVSNASFEQVMTFAEELDLPVHLHLHETLTEITESLKLHGVRPIARLSALGVVGPRLIAVHAVHLDPGEIALFAREGVSVAHCPHSNLKLGSGIAPIPALRAGGVNVGIGTDGAASNNRLDLLAELHTAALLAKGVTGNAAALPAAEALELATLGGARALGLDGVIGSLVPGKFADMIAVHLDAIECLPLFDPIAQLAYSAGREQVRHVWVAGERLLIDRVPTRIDLATVRAQATLWGARIAAAARPR
jgi:5-methylthioadenosine/S-adenosylhomocysteine deaminase